MSETHDTRDSPVAKAEQKDDTVTGNLTHSDLLKEEIDKERDSSSLLPAAKMENFPTIFGKIREQNITFCIDTSGSMYRYLDVIKEHLIEKLFTLAQEGEDKTFNIVEFSSNVTQWSDKMVKCTPQTAAVAAQWVKGLQPKTGTNSMDALVTSFADSTCSAVCLVTDGIPDQEASEFLDNVVQAADNRPVHCYYIQDGKPDQHVCRILQELAMDTYGTFHMITVSSHGAIERITPIYRAECTAEKIIRTNTGSIITANDKLCSVSTTLDQVPLIVENPITVPGFAPATYPMYPYYLYPWPYRFYYRNYAPAVGWARYRPSRSWMKESKECIAAGIDFAPGPGCLLIGTGVLARRIEDGLFYLGKVKSQIQTQKFLIEFGPCKHGKWKDTVYQETYIHDIISHDDAMRHAILTNDKVFAPWEPEGERYGPGIVIEGQEQRSSQESISDQTLVVSFYNGKTASLPLATAVWVPPALYDRIEFELRLPRNVREDLSEQAVYPKENLPGYPTDDDGALPRDFDIVTSRWINRPDHDFFYPYHPYYVPRLPLFYKRTEKAKQADDDDQIDYIIPGTNLTKSTLNEKVMSQLMEYKMVLEDGKSNIQHENEKLLSRRQNRESNGILKQSNKSVSFSDSKSDLEEEYDAGDLEMRNSNGTPTEIMSDGEIEYDPEKRHYVNPCKETHFDEGFDLHHCSKRRSRSRSRSAGRSRSRSKSRERPPWRYWKNDPAPELMDPLHYGPYRLGPYEETIEPVPLEIREQLMGPYGVEWNASLGKYVDCLARQKSVGSVRDSLGYYPHPPSVKPDKQGPGVDISVSIGGNLSEAERTRLSRQEFRRQRTLAREEDWQKRVQEDERMKHVMMDQHRERIISQLNRERERQENEMNKVSAQREAKKLINDHLRSRIENNIEREREKTEQRLEAARQNRARRDDIAASRRKEIQDKISRAEEARKYNTEKRWHSHCARLAQFDADKASVDAHRQHAKAERLTRFRKREEKQQAMKELLSHYGNQSSAIFRSQVLP